MDSVPSLYICASNLDHNPLLLSMYKMIISAKVVSSSVPHSIITCPYHISHIRKREFVCDLCALIAIFGHKGCLKVRVCSWWGGGERISLLYCFLSCDGSRLPLEPNQGLNIDLMWIG